MTFDSLDFIGASSTPPGLGLFEQYQDRQSLTHAVSSRMVDLVGEAFRRKGRASLALAGGRTPLEIYQRLAAWPLRWDWVDVTLTGEGWVNRTSLERCANMVRHRLLTDNAAQANFIPFVPAWEDDPGHAALVHSVWNADRAVRALGQFDCVLLGMGLDGHIASIFPNNPANHLLLDPENPNSCQLSPAHPGGPRQPRISLTLGEILRSRKVMLVIRGKRKFELLRRALATPDPGGVPVAALLHQDRNPVEVFWSL